MGDYAIYFEFDNMQYRLPVNPEELNETSVMAIEKYEVLKLGQIAVPQYMSLREFSFDAEFPCEVTSYVLKPDSFISADTFLKSLEKIRENLLPVKFVYGLDSDEDEYTGDSLMVLIEEMNITEKAGEEGDKYVSFKLLEHRKYGWKEVVEVKSSGSKTTKKTNAGKKASNPKKTGSYVVKSGDTLWSIAKKLYGDGADYKKILNANKDKIKNPSLLYPGQKLVIP